jgi:threonine/homoserine/homoserine lactone efflux protein
MYAYLIIGFTYALAAVAQPGPYQGYLISQTLRKGWRKTLPATLAPLITDGPIIIIVVLVLSRIPAGFICVIQIGGGIFLLYIAADILRKWKNYDSGIAKDDEQADRTLMQAVLINILNPSPYIGWSLIMGPLLMKGWREAPSNGIALLTSFYGTMITATIGLIFLFAFAKKTGPAVTRTMFGISGIALGCFGLYQLYNGINGIT